MNSQINEREVIIEFLQLYRQFRCLWDSACQQYSNRDARNQALQILQEKLATIDSTTTVAIVKKKIENMRASYKRERKKLLDSKSTGAGGDKVYVNTLWYYEYLTFLHENDSLNRSGVDTLTCDDDEEEVTEIPSKPQARPIKRNLTVSKKQEMLIDAAHKLISQQDNPLVAYGISTGHQLQEMTKTQRIIAEKLISEIIFYGKMDKLTINTSIHLNETTNATWTPSPSSSSPGFFYSSSSGINSPAASTPVPTVQICAPQNDNAIDFDNQLQLETFGSSKYTLEDYVIIKKF